MYKLNQRPINHKSKFLTKALLLTSMLTLVALALVLILHPQPKYVYPVRERISNGNGNLEWDLYCWNEYDDGHIDKKFVGHFKIYHSTDVGEGTETSLCPKKGVL